MPEPCRETDKTAHAHAHAQIIATKHTIFFPDRRAHTAVELTRHEFTLTLLTSYNPQAMIQAYRDPATCAKQKKKDVPVPLQGHLGGDGGGGGSNFSKRKSSSTADW